MITFADKYTTQEKLTASPLTEKSKVIVTNDAYVVSELLEALFNKIEHLRVSLIK